MSSPELIRLKAECRDNPARFNRRVLGRPPVWWRQQELCESVLKYPTTLAPAGNSVGKSWWAAGVILWFLCTKPGSKVVATAPTQTQLEEVLWSKVVTAHENSRVKLGGRSLKSPLKIDKGGEWAALAYSTTKTERLSGHHNADLLAVIDEGSGVEPAIWEAVDSLNPSRLLVLGNPLRPDGPFYERCVRAAESPSGLVNVVTIPSTDSPDAHLPRSHRGLADAGFLAKSANDYGADSAWFSAHILAEFPDSGVESLLKRSWLDRAGQAAHSPRGRRRLAVDLAEGKGGDRSVLLVRDDNGILWLEYSPRWDFETTATRAALLCQRFGVQPFDVTFDQGGVGADFGNRLMAVGLVGCQPYRGGLGTADKGYFNFRAKAAFALRRRLDPGHTVEDARGVLVPQTPFAVPPEHLAAMRDELQGLRHEPDRTGAVKLEAKEELAKRLRKSPDLADALIMSFAF